MGMGAATLPAAIEKSDLSRAKKTRRGAKNILANNKVPIASLCSAIESDDAKLVKRFLKKNADAISAKDKYEALRVLATNQSSNVEELVLEYIEETVNEIDAEGDTVLLAACKTLLLSQIGPKEAEEAVAIVKLLLSHGALVEQRDEGGRSALHYAAKLNKQKELIPLLLSACADKNVLDASGNNALHVFLGHVKSSGQPLSELDLNIALEMLARKVSVQAVNDKGVAPIFLAFLFDNKLLLRKSLARLLRNIDIRDKRGNSLLMHLIKRRDSYNEKDFVPTVKELTRKKIDFEARNWLGRTALHYAVIRRRPWVLSWLIKYGADVNARSDRGNTALHYLGQQLSSRNTDKNLAERLINCGADVNARNADGMTPLMVAAQLGHDEVVPELAKHQHADLHCASYGRGHTALHLALINGNGYVAKVLLEQGASIDARSASGRTPLHYACFNEQRHFNRKSEIELLLHHGADANARDDFGRTPLDYSLRCERDTEAIEALEMHAILLQQAQLPAQCVDVGRQKYAELVKRCRDEIHKMRSVKIKEDVSLVDLLRMNERQLSALSNNFKVKLIFTPDKDFAAIKKKYKTYGYLLINRYRVGEIRHSLSRSAKASFHEFANGAAWPDELYDKVFDYLSIKDLQSINASVGLKVACKRKFAQSKDEQSSPAPAKRTRFEEYDVESLLNIPNFEFLTQTDIFAC